MAERKTAAPDAAPTDAPTAATKTPEAVPPAEIAQADSPTVEAKDPISHAAFVSGPGPDAEEFDLDSALGKDGVAKRDIYQRYLRRGTLTPLLRLVTREGMTPNPEALAVYRAQQYPETRDMRVALFRSEPGGSVEAKTPGGKINGPRQEGRLVVPQGSRRSGQLDAPAPDPEDPGAGKVGP